MHSNNNFYRVNALERSGNDKINQATQDEELYIK